jgi:prolyl oligopeptidase
MSRGRFSQTFIWCTLLAAAVLAGTVSAADEDPWLWLEEIEGERSLAWVEQQNNRTTSMLTKVDGHDAIYERVLSILDSEEKIPYPSLRGSMVYNFWQDSEHQRGIWRRTTIDSYRSDDPEWEIVIDFDALSEAEGVPWVYKGADCLEPESKRCIVQLSRGGSDAVSLREFDTVEKSWVADGFTLADAKTIFSWKDADTLYIATDFGEGSLTTSGYPRIVKEWRRGTELAKARLLFEGESSDVLVAAQSTRTLEDQYDVVVRVITFMNVETYMVLDDRLVRLDIPSDAIGRGVFKDHMLLSLRSDWTVGDTTYGQGALLAIDIDDLLQGKTAPDVLFEPTETAFLNGVSTTSDKVLITTLESVRSRLYRIVLSNDGWKQEAVELPGLGTVGAGGNPFDERFIFNYQDFTTPSSLFLVDQGKVEELKKQPVFFDSEGITVTQNHAVSADGTKIPYFLVTPKGFKTDGTTPTIVTGYGGFEVNVLPTYNATRGAAWLERGGAFVLANLRGGGEFGPAWHQVAQREGRIKWFQDFIAIADDLVERKVTSRGHLGIVGGSNSGLLVAGAFTLRPDLCRAVVSQVPLTDMKRYHKLLAGASWMSEYGNPDVPEDWAYMKKWSPYHNLQKDADYPTVFFWANHRDDRVHPGHARKMTAKMLDIGHDDVYYFEHIEGGHGVGAINSQRAELIALEYAFFWKTLQ